MGNQQTNVAVIRSESGYTLIEIMMVALLIGILGAMAGIQIGAARPAYQADGAMRVMMSELNVARDTAVAQRRFVRVVLTGPGTVSVVRVDQTAPNPDDEVTTVLRTVSFESGMEFGRGDDIGDSPDGFGDSSETGDGAVILFNHEGMAVTTAGVPANHTVFLYKPDEPLTQRAVTVMGGTGRVRAYRWLSGDNWTRV